MADLSSKQIAMAREYVSAFSDFLRTYYVLTNKISRAADAPIVWDDAVLDSVDAAGDLKHVDAADIVAAEGLANQLVTYLSQNGRRQILEKMTPS